MHIEKLISKEARGVIREAISTASGNEVFFFGTFEDGVVTEVSVAARGNDAAVPAVRAATRPGGVVIHNHPSGVLTPSDADLNIAASLAEDNIAFYIVDNLASAVYVVTEPHKAVPKVCIGDGEVEMMLGPDGPVASKLDGYEIRQEQVDMATEVAGAFNGEKTLVVEAGTGVGKSLAYLLPSILWAVRNKERVVVSTKTINLQEQLTGKDIPFLQSALDIDFKAVLIKGRSNYLCLRKLDDTAKEPGLFEEKGEVKTITEWAGKTADGSLSDLGFMPKETVWAELASETDTCLRLKCGFYDRCFFHLSRRTAADADILITNHHLLFSDLAVKEAKGNFTEAAVIAPYKRAVLDEAHSIEDIATEYFGEIVSSRGVAKQLSRLWSARDSRRGLLPFLATRIIKAKLRLEDTVDDINGNISTDIMSAHASATEIFSMLFHFFESVALPAEGPVKLRLTRVVTGDENWPDVEREVRGFTEKLRRLCTSLKALTKGLGKVMAEDDEAEKELLSKVLEVSAVTGRLSHMAQAVDSILFGKGEDSVRWVHIEPAVRGGGFRINLRLSPLNVGGKLFSNLYSKLKTTVLTSATLSVGGGFKFLEGRTGIGLIPPEKKAEKLLKSPFDYKTKVRLVLDSTLREPTSSGFNASLSERIPALVKERSGATLILFTSYALLNSLYGKISGEIEEMGFNTLRQGRAPRHELLRRFREDLTSVLFGTDSFWEGVDVPGDALKTVVITRLPFEVPDDPVAEARRIDIEENGGNAFREYALPKAVIKFRQGFGRLIRKKTDSGIVVVLDKRIVTKSYGKTFLKSVPECEVLYAEEKALV